MSTDQPHPPVIIGGHGYGANLSAVDRRRKRTLLQGDLQVKWIGKPFHFTIGNTIPIQICTVAFVFNSKANRAGGICLRHEQETSSNVLKKWTYKELTFGKGCSRRVQSE